MTVAASLVFVASHVSAVVADIGFLGKGVTTMADAIDDDDYEDDDELEEELDDELEDEELDDYEEDEEE